VLSPLTAFTKDHLIETFKVPSASMVPAILPGDRFFADKRVGHRGGPPVHRGDVAVFVYPNDRTTMYVKRVVGLPGDRIQIDGMLVLVNGQTIVGDEVHDLGSAELNRQLTDHRAFGETVDGKSYVVLWRTDGAHDALTTIVPSGQVFVLGDNRDSSRDSRQFGALPLADVSGVARQIWFSADKDSGLRVRRTGKVIDAGY
jgi:signal peptidase I